MGEVTHGYLGAERTIEQPPCLGNASRRKILLILGFSLVDCMSQSDTVKFLGVDSKSICFNHRSFQKPIAAFPEILEVF